MASYFRPRAAAAAQEQARPRGAPAQGAQGASVNVGPEPVYITSDAGDRIEYVFTPLSVDIGLALGARLVPILETALRGVHPSMRTLGPAIASMINGKSSGDNIARAAGIAAALGEPLADLLGTLAKIIIDNGDVEIFHAILHGTIRRTVGVSDGLQFKGDDASKKHFNRIYAANYGELFTAVGHALAVNFGPWMRRLGKALGLDGLSLTSRHTQEPGAPSESQTPQG